MDGSIGLRVQEARRLARLSQAQLASATGISQPTMSRIESGTVSPSFEDICAIARETRTPLLFLATGYGQSGLGVPALVAQLSAWGLRDMDVGGVPILGESRSFEELLSAAARIAEPRIVPAIPGLFLRNPFSAPLLNVFARKEAVRNRLGWLAEVAYSIARSRPLVGLVRPDSPERLQLFFRAAWARRRRRAQHDWDSLLQSSASEDERTIPSLSRSAAPIARKWRIADSTTETEFIERAIGVLRE